MEYDGLVLPAVAREAFHEVLQMETASKQWAGVLQRFNSALQPFSSPQIANATNDHNVDYLEFRRNPTVLYLQIMPSQIGDPHAGW